MLQAWLQAQAPRLRGLWQQRRDAGHVREGHGDLHLANAVLLGGEVTAFDCIEFDPALRWIDVLNDIAFLVMDLLAHGRGDLAFRFLNAYLDEHRRPSRACRCCAGISSTARWCGRWWPASAPGRAGRRAGPDHLALALRLAGDGDARLLVTHGVSGSGKSWVAQQLLEQAQAIRLRSDVERKRLFGLRALEASASRVPGGIYGSDATRRTYARLRELAAWRWRPATASSSMPPSCVATSATTSAAWRRNCACRSRCWTAGRRRHCCANACVHAPNAATMRRRPASRCSDANGRRPSRCGQMNRPSPSRSTPPRLRCRGTGGALAGGALRGGPAGTARLGLHQAGAGSTGAESSRSAVRMRHPGAPPRQG